MNKFIYFPIAVLSIGMFGCSNGDELFVEQESLLAKINDRVEVTIEESHNGSRATLEDDGTILWKEKDGMIVYVEHGDYFYDKEEDIYISDTQKEWIPYVAEMGESSVIDFVSEVGYPESPHYKWVKQYAFYGLHDYVEYLMRDVTFDESSSKMNFFIQTENNIPFILASKIAEESQNSIQLYNAGAVLKVVINNIPDDSPYYRLSLEARDANNGLSGDAEITFNEQGMPILKVLPDEKGLYNTILDRRLKFPDSIEKSETTFYFTIPPAYYREGLKLTLSGDAFTTDYNLGILKDETGSLKVNRNDFISMVFEYHDYADATNENIATAFENSNYVRLVDNEVILSSDLVIDKGNDEVILDLNGNTLIIADGTSLINKSDLKIRNGVISVVSSGNNIVNEGNVSIYDVEFVTTGLGSNPEGKMGYVLLNKGTAVIGGRQIESYGAGGIACNGIVNEGKLTIATGSYFFGALDGYCIYNQNPGAELYIYGGRYGGMNGILTSNGAKTVIYDCEVNAWGNDSHAITLMGETSSVVIKGGLFESHGDCVVNLNTDIPSYNDERLLIQGGRFGYTSYDGYGFDWGVENGYRVPILY